MIKKLSLKELFIHIDPQIEGVKFIAEIEAGSKVLIVRGQVRRFQP